MLTIILCTKACDIALSAANTWHDWIPLVSPFVVILLFIIDRILGFFLRKKEVERNWYLKVLVEPGIQRISEFYRTSTENYQQSAELLDSNKGQSHEEYNKLKSKEFGKFQALKRDLEIEVIYPIQIRYPDVGKQITEQLRNLEDNFTSSLDAEKFNSSGIKEFHDFAANNRALFLDHLYDPLNKKFIF